METNSILKIAQRATKKREETEKLYEEIEKKLIKITGLKNLKIGYLPGDGIGVCLEEEGNVDSAGLLEVLGVIFKHGTITKEEIIDLTCF